MDPATAKSLNFRTIPASGYLLSHFDIFTNLDLL
jgi:hypothetical protein